MLCHHNNTKSPTMAPLSSPYTLHNDSGHSYDVLSAERFADPLNCQLHKLTVSSPRRVRFSHQQDRILNPQIEYYTDEDTKIKWWGNDALLQIRQRVKALSALLRHRAKSHDCDLTMAHHKTTLILASDFHSLIKLTPSSPDQDLAKWCSQDDGRRGLERFSSKVYHCFRRRDVTDTRKAVIREQERQRAQKICDPEAIAQISAKGSRRARNFALFFGGADAKQILKREQEAPARRAPPRKRSKISLRAS
jgi:hypothetical protein